MEEHGVNGEDVKKAVNNLIWMYSPKELTLEEAEKRACEIYEIILRGPLKSGRE